MKNNNIYLTLEERIQAFKEYCNTQPSCPCKFANEHCELKWLDSEALEEEYKLDPYSKDVLNENI